MLNSIKTLWKVDKLHFLLIGLFIFVYSWVYRVALRAMMDGAPFRWVNLLNKHLLGEKRNAYIGGNGMDGHFVVILLFAIFFCAILYLLIRRPDTFTKVLMIFWNISFLIHQITLSIVVGEEYTISGDTFGVEIPYYIIGPGEQLVFLLLTVLWIFRNKTRELEFVPLSEKNKSIMIGCLLLTPLMFIALRFGEQNGLTDKIGIMLMYPQLCLMVFGLISLRRKESIAQKIGGNLETSA